MNLFKKLKKNICRPSEAIRKIIHRLPMKRRLFLRFPSYENIEQEVFNIVEGNDKPHVFIFPIPACPWGYMFQRPQQMAKALGEIGYLVFYTVDTAFPGYPDWYVRGIQKVDHNVYLFNDGSISNNVGRLISGKHKVVWQYWPHQRQFVEELNEENNSIIHIYDCIDHIDTFTSYSNIYKDHMNALQQAAIVIATANGIKQEIGKIRGDSILIANGVNLDDFRNPKLKNWPFLKNIKSKSDVVVGYYGAIAEWFDFAIVDYVAKKRNNWIFLIVGEVYPAVEGKLKGLLKNQNVIYHPRVSYSEIPQLLNSFDIAILPFIINDITKNTSPVKVFEYLAGGKNTVSTPLPEVLGIKNVFIADNPEDFNQKLHLAYEMKNLFIQNDDIVSYSWNHKAQIIIDKVNAVIK